METAVIDRKRLQSPSLRFKNFHEDWVITNLKSITKYVKGFAFKSEDYRSLGTRIIRVSDLGSNFIKGDGEMIFISPEKESFFEKYRLEPGNIIITTVGSKPEMIESAVGRGIFVKEKGIGLLNQNLLKFENIKDVDNGFLIGLINSKKYQHYIKGIARGNANQANITVEDLLNFKVTVPIYPEQQKIASFLSAVDKKIQQLTRKKELLEQYKKGVMQQIFSRKLRFKDENGNDYPEWKEKRLGEVAEKIQDGTHFSPKPAENGDYFYLTSKNVKNGYIDLSTAERISKEEHSSIYKRCDIKKGDVLLTKDGTIGQVCVNELDFEYSLLSSVAFIRVSSMNNSYFLYHLLTSPIGQTEIKRKIAGQALKRITLTKIKNFEFLFPSLQEQKEIAELLSLIDLKIRGVQAQLSYTQIFKKGLLQQMFV